MGEAGTDAGGPRREYLTNLCKELTEKLKLFIKSPNSLHNVGEEREKMVPNPKANSQSDLDNYYKVGMLFAVSIKLRECLELDLPQILWKYIMSRPSSPSPNPHLGRHQDHQHQPVRLHRKDGVHERRRPRVPRGNLRHFPLGRPGVRARAPRQAQEARSAQQAGVHRENQAGPHRAPGQALRGHPQRLLRRAHALLLHQHRTSGAGERCLRHELRRLA